MTASLKTAEMHLARLGLIVALLLPPSCGERAQTEERKPDSLIFYDWPGDMPDVVLDAFEKETGIEVEYLTYDETEEAVDNVRRGEVYDVMVLETRMVPSAIEDKLIRPLDLERIPNRKNIAAHFRDLIFDPGGRYTIPFNWGVVGLLVNTERATKPITGWADLWDPAHAGKVGVWATMPREMIAIALKMLGLSVNSERPADIARAEQQLAELKERAFILERVDPVTCAPGLAGGQVVVAVAWAEDDQNARELNLPVQFVHPREGGLLWTDNFVIPATSRSPENAHLFLDFLLRPDIGAQIANENRYATCNEAALDLIDSELLEDPVVFPPSGALQSAELLLPLSDEGARLLAEIWDRLDFDAVLEEE